MLSQESQELATAELDPELGARLRAMSDGARQVEPVAALVEQVPTVPADPAGERAAPETIHA